MLRSDDRPQLPVGDAELGVIAAGGDPVADADLLPRRRELAAGDLTGGDADLVRESVDLRDLLAGVGDHQLAAHGTCGERRGPLDLAGVHDHEPAAHELVEDLTSSLTTAHPQRQVGVLRIGEAADPLELDDAIGCVASREVEHSPASDGGELVPVADQRHLGAGVVGELEERAGGVLVEHPGLVDDEEGTAVQPRRTGRRRHPSPPTVRVPAVAVLVQQPRHGVRCPCRPHRPRPGRPSWSA